jgi:hypothetical protein
MVLVMLLLVDGRRIEVKFKKWQSVRALNESLKERKIKKNVMLCFYSKHNKNRREHT